MGMIAVLHTWGQLSLHPHLHCIVPAEEWTKRAMENSRSNGKFLISSKGFIESFRAKFYENSKQKSL
jgi:hypothetical protein